MENFIQKPGIIKLIHIFLFAYNFLESRHGYAFQMFRVRVQLNES